MQECSVIRLAQAVSASSAMNLSLFLKRWGFRRPNDAGRQDAVVHGRKPVVVASAPRFAIATDAG